jgi:molybdate transport system substrate-binding protein
MFKVLLERKILMNKFRKCTALLLMLLIMSGFCLAGCSQKASTEKTPTAQALKYQGQSLLVHSGAGLSQAMDEMGQAFAAKTGAKVNFNYAACAQLLNQMATAKQGDVFVGGSISDGDTAIQKGFTDKYVAIAYHIPAIAVPKGNPAGITSLADMAKPGMKLILGDEQTNAIGKKGAMIFTKNNLTDSINKNVVSRAATVNEIVTQIGMKQGDAGLVFEDNGVDAKDIEIISIPEAQNSIDKVPVCVLKFTQNADLAQAFVDFITSDEGKAIMVKHGFKTIN